MNIRNIAIIAHVDHGKTTLVDGMLKQTHTFRENQAEMGQTTILDSNELEREKGITILAKNTAVHYKDYKINIIDTPGHADFSGEVERVINMADGAVLVIDSAEGPLPQTKFVLEKALGNHLPVIVVVNKIDRKDSRVSEVLRETEELFLQLAHTDAHLDYSVIYAIGREGKAWKSMPANFDQPGSLEPLFETIVNKVPPPKKDEDKPFKMLISTLDFDEHKGTFAIGKVTQGRIRAKQRVFLMDENIKLREATVTEVTTSVGLVHQPVMVSEPGDIIAIAGIEGVAIGNTITDPEDPTGYPAIRLEEPTLKIVLAANTSPFAGREGDFVTSRQIEERINRELRTNIGLKITSNKDGIGWVIAGRGELHLAVLFETMRREGYEFQVGKPEVIKKEIDGVKCEPYEELTIEIDVAFVGVITEELGKRRAELLDTHTDDRNITRSVYKVSSQNLLGFRGDILTKTRGNGIFASRFIGYFPEGARLTKLRNGVILSTDTGKSTAYAIETVQERGRPFVHPGVDIYEGMIVGLNSRSEDIEVNICKSKKLTNMHSATSDMATKLDSPLIMTLEQCLDFIEDDELLEITPRTLRLRKRYLSRVDRTRAKRA